MKNLLQATFGWLSGSKAEPASPITTENLAVKMEPPTAPVEPSEVVESKAPVIASVKPLVESQSVVESQPLFERKPVIEIKPVVAPQVTETSEVAPGTPQNLALVSVKVKAGVVYGTCPHCESVWNLKDRIRRHSVARPGNTVSLSCPSCDRPLALPEQLNLK